MRNVLGRACPHEGCEESIIEARRERRLTITIPDDSGVPVAVCPAEHVSVIRYDLSGHPPELTPFPRPPEPPDISGIRRWGKAPLLDRILRRLNLRR